MTKWFILIGVVLILCIAEWIREIRTFRTTHYDITSEKLKSLKQEQKVLFLTDLHNNSYGKQNKRLLEAVRDQKPELILIGGDMLVGKKGKSAQVAADLVSQLAGICPVCYANGNHEQRMKVYPETYGNAFREYATPLSENGVIFLENKSMDFLWEDLPVQIHGLEIPMEYYKPGHKRVLTAEDIEKCIGKPDDSKYQILLAHNPIYADAYIEWGADLILSGHLHGGIVRIPKLGGIITPQFSFFPRYSGELTVKENTSVVVSKGLGTHTIKMRFLNPAELIVLHINGTKR